MEKNKVLEVDVVKTILVLVLSLLVCFYFSEYNGLLYSAFLIGSLSLVSKKIATKIHLAWFKVAAFLNMITTPLILIIVYYFILTPVAFLSEKMGEKDRLKLKNKYSSMFVNCNKSYDRKSFEKLW